MVDRRKLAKTLRKNEEFDRVFHQGGSSIAEAEKYLKRSGWQLLDFHFKSCTLEELRVWFTVIKPMRKYHHLLPSIENCLVARFEETKTAQDSVAAKSAIRRSAKEYGSLSASELIERAHELTESQVVALLQWERENKNRAVVLKELQKMLPDQNLTSSASAAFAKSPESNLGQNPYAEQNRKIFKRGRGFIQERCRECGAFTPIDVELLSRILHARANTTRSRMDSWANRQVESGSRISGRIAASEQARANRNAFAQQVSQGIPCSNCGAQLIR